MSLMCIIIFGQINNIVIVIVIFIVIVYAWSWQSFVKYLGMWQDRSISDVWWMKLDIMYDKVDKPTPSLPSDEMNSVKY